MIDTLKSVESQVFYEIKKKKKEGHETIYYVIRGCIMSVKPGVHAMYIMSFIGPLCADGRRGGNFFICLGGCMLMWLPAT